MGSQYHPYDKLASNMRDWKLSEVGNYDLTWAAEEVEGGMLNTGRDDSSEPKGGLVLFNRVRVSGRMICRCF